MTRKFFSSNDTRDITKKTEFVDAYLCGPVSTESLSDAKYFLLIVNDAIRCRYVVFLKKKSYTLCEFKSFVKSMHFQGYGNIRALRTDSGTEFVNKYFRNFISSEGIQHKTSAPYGPEYNGLVERTNRTLVERKRSVLHYAHFSTNYWAEAISAACYLKNLTTIRVIQNKTPHQEFIE